MAMKHFTRKILKAMSFQNVKVTASRKIADLKKIDFCKRFYRKQDYLVYRDGTPIAVRVFYPEQSEKHPGIFLFFHGGGWTTDSIDTYQRICARLSNATNQVVVSVDYRLAPEYKFPTGLLDCYQVTKRVYQHVNEDKITLIGDSAGGNIAAAISLMAKEKQEFTVQKQVLIYPAVSGNYTDPSLFPSMEENGFDYVLTMGKLQDYATFYASSEEDKQNPYFAPLVAKDVSKQPATLLITAEFDPLRDEAEAYGTRLKDAGNTVEMHRIKDAIHGFFALGIKHYHVQECFDLINAFIQKKS